MNKTFEQVSNAKHHFFIDEILFGRLDQLEWKTLLPYPKPFAIL